MIYKLNRNYNGHRLYIRDPYNPLNLPDYTLRLKYDNRSSPSLVNGTATRVSTNPNIWDVTYENPNWGSFFDKKVGLLSVLGGNTTNVTSMADLFHGAFYLTSVNLFDTTNVTNMDYMFDYAKDLKDIPEFNTSNVTSMKSMFSNCSALSSISNLNTHKVTNMVYTFKSCINLSSCPAFDLSSLTNSQGMFEDAGLRYVPSFTNTDKLKNTPYMFYNCYYVESGASAFYEQLSQNTGDFYHKNTFTNCGINTVQGAAELAQIPTSWGGTKE